MDGISSGSHRQPTRDSIDYTGHTDGWVEVHLLAVRPGQSSCIGACVGNDAIQKHARGAACGPELSPHHWQRPAGVRGIVGEVRPAYVIPRLVFMSHTDHEGMPA